jgi:hypothetical protein
MTAPTISELHEMPDGTRLYCWTYSYGDNDARTVLVKVRGLWKTLRGNINSTPQLSTNLKMSQYQRVEKYKININAYNGAK